MIIETLKRLAVAGKEVLCQDLTVKALWENIDNFMTDSVIKNLEVEKCVGEKLWYLYIPHHFLCKPHVVEKFDETNFKVLSNIEIQLQLRERFEYIDPSLKPFFREKKAIALAGIAAITKLITQEKTGNPS